MREVFYIDTYFFLNLAADGLALWIVSRILPQRMRFGRFLAAALFGGLYATLLAFVEAPVWVCLVTLLPAAALMCFFAFPWNTWRRLLRATLFFLLTCLIMGGTVYAATVLVGKSASDASLSLLWLVILVALGATVFGVYFFCIRRRFDTRVKTVRLPLGEKNTLCSALSDSGNLLKEPTSGLSVMLLGSDCAMRLLPAETRLALTFGNASSDFEIFPITASGAGGECLLYAMRLCGAKLLVRGKSRELPELMLALDTHHANYAGCDLLLPAEFS